MTKDKKGTILITTLWILALLTLLALGVGIRTSVNIKLMGFFLNHTKAHYLAEAGLRKTIALLEIDSNKLADSLNEVWSSGFDNDEEEFILKDIKAGEGAFTVSYKYGEDEEGNPLYLYGASDEEGKLNINKISSDLLASLPDFSIEIASAVLDWRDEDNLARPDGAENDYYNGLEGPYECKNAKFSVPEELMLVKGVTKEIYDRVKDIITVYGESEAVNINTSSEDVLAILLGEEFEELPAKIVNYRNGRDGLAGTEDDRIFTDTRTIVTQLSDPLAGGLTSVEQNYLNNLILGKKYFKVYSNTFRIISRGEVKDGRIKKTIEAVVKRTNEGSEILYYHEG